MAVTIKDIARKAGVSHTTVSRALLGNPLISMETTERIRRLAAEMGYRPSAAARSLKTNRSRVLGVIVSNIDDPYFSEVLQGIENTAQESGYSLFIAASQRDPEREHAIVQTMVEHRVEGVIICSSSFSAQQGRNFVEYGVPIVAVNNQAAEDYRYSIYHDDLSGSRQVTAHLVGLGHKRIAYLGNALSGRTNLDRLNGYQQELKAAGLASISGYVHQVPYGLAGQMEQAVGHFLRLSPPPTALVCYNDMMAIEIMQALQHAGLQVPRDISITGFDNIVFSAYTSPPLTTFDQPKRFIGAEACRLLLGLLGMPPDDGRDAADNVRVLGGRLLVRDSTASPQVSFVTPHSMEPHRFALHSTSLDLAPHSLAFDRGLEYALARFEAGRGLVVLSTDPACSLDDFSGERSEVHGNPLVVCPLDACNAAALRSHLDWLRPRPLGLRTSAGMGDRLGLATPGHVRALRSVNADIAPIFAQQSMREMARTGRTPAQVLDDATWGMFSEGWQNGAGADADHLKTFEDIDVCLSAGFTFFTIDPGAQVDARAEQATLDELRELAGALPGDLQPRASGLEGGVFNIEGLSVTFDEPTLLRAAVKYGRAIAHVASMYHHLEQAAGDRAFELEVSVDETDQSTSHADHIYIASELKRLGVKWVSLAPRYVGRFEKGVDYIGDVSEFESDIAGHAAIARQFGPYKLSLHSGSDKFSIYAAAACQTRGLVHLKTAGTSYLEALRTVAALDPDLLREIYVFARERYGTDRASYHVSAEVARAPEPAWVHDWIGLLDQFDAREILHVTFGSVLTDTLPDGAPRFRDRLLSLLRSNPEAYAANLERHFGRHLQPFAGTESR